MTQPDDNAAIEWLRSLNQRPQIIHQTEQVYSRVRNHLDMILAHVRDSEPQLYRIAATDDPSALFDFVKGYILASEREHGQEAHNVTILMCAAAITRLVRASRTDEDTLTQLRKDIDNT